LKIRPLNEFDPPHSRISLTEFENENSIDVCDNHGKIRKYGFDLVAGPLTTQTEFFEQCGVETLIQSVFAGFSATVFAYGQTGSGKSYSMAGPVETAISQQRITEKSGLMQRAAQNICKLAKQKGFSIQTGYIEIYNEQVRDLLDIDSGIFGVRGDLNQGFYVENQLFVECSSFDDVMAVIVEGNSHREISSHKLNRDSSRSHCILTIIVTQRSSQSRLRGRINFVDLAGSERLKDSKSSGAVSLKETANINKSLFVLGKVISQLSKKSTNPHSTDVHVAYRDSVLTKLLRNSLGGEAMVLMIATVNPTLKFVEETISTINYATRVMNIKNKPMRKNQHQSKDHIIEELRAENRKLRSENKKLRRLVSSTGRDTSNLRQTQKSHPMTPKFNSASDASSPIFKSPLSTHREKLKEENERLNERLTLLENVFVNNSVQDDLSSPSIFRL